MIAQLIMPLESVKTQGAERLGDGENTNFGLIPRFAKQQFLTGQKVAVLDVIVGIAPSSQGGRVR